MRSQKKTRQMFVNVGLGFRCGRFRSAQALAPRSANPVVQAHRALGAASSLGPRRTPPSLPPPRPPARTARRRPGGPCCSPEDTSLRRCRAAPSFTCRQVGCGGTLTLPHCLHPLGCGQVTGAHRPTMPCGRPPRSRPRRPPPPPRLPSRRSRAPRSSPSWARGRP